jgi:hypothetical protein
MSSKCLGPIVLSACVLLFGAARPVVDSAREFESAAYGFSIDPPLFEVDPECPNAMVAQFFAPPEDGFAPNLNIQRQRHEGSLEEYVKLSAAQMEGAGWNVLESKAGAIGDRATHFFRFHGTVASNDLEFASLAVRDGESHVLLLTCTMPQERASELKNAFDDSFASLKFD